MTPSLSDSLFDRLTSAVALTETGEARYELFEELGRGGMGIVYRAHDRRLQRDIALKVLNPDVRDQEHVLAEACITARLEHPGIIPVHDAGVLPDGRLFCAMKLVRGQRLDVWTQSHPGLNDRLAAFLRVCDAVAFAHSRGVVHRDLKPGNIMVGDFGEVLVLDWGIATDQPGEASAGTPGFMAPEPQASAAADVFALGKVLQRVAATAARHRTLESIAAKATAQEPALRYAAVADLAADVRAFMAREPVAAHRENVAERALRLASRHRTLLALIVAYLIMRIGLIFFPWRS